MAERRHAVRRGSHRAPRPTGAAGTLDRVLWTGGGLLHGRVLPPVAALIAATSFVAGSVAQVTLSQIQADALQVEQRAAALAAEQAQERHDAASTARLSAQATAYLAHRRTEARSIAEGAVQTADELTAASGTYLDDDERDELDAALAELTALLQQTPDAETALDTALQTLPAVDVEPVVVEPPAVSPIEPLADVTELLAASVADASTSTPAPAAADVVLDPGRTDAGSASRGLTIPRAEPTTATPLVVATGDATPISSDATDPDPEPAPSTDTDRPTGSATDDAGEVGEVTDPAPGLSPDPGAVPSAADDASADAAVLATADLALSDSEHLVEVAQRLLDLSAEVQAVVEQRKAEEQARLAAEAAAAAEEARIAASFSAKVAAADAAPNGEIPTQYLCGVTFQRGVLLRCDAAAALDKLNTAYRQATGHSLTVVSSYRTAEEQAALVEEKGEEIAAAAGTSQHGRGQAIDLAGAGQLGQFDAPLYLWLTEHAEDFGWHHPSYMDPGGAGPLEPWHWEFHTGT
ncbi:M15 family metallopeptidase [Actinotalea sp. M2MS4P-6]|uniref:M15 family metallopeptidase n=1 Tax=Actinotalea sp. M2MS4P-6 TaxID=2983762 RepID=UPI0021E447BE|nr:M15 family metallopeptidase [Actinotalea sp. M2MS4P-6]MCV2394644.1 M15 family metallopeptidase [Actinotalea sp. M2MS4P-6]